MKVNGELWAESEFGKGSTFSLRLKNVKYNMDELGNIPLKEETEEFNQAMRKQVQALLVDDVPMNLKVLHSMLKKMNVQCVLAASAEEALELIRKGYVFDIILSDLWMPGLSGSDFAGNPETRSGNGTYPAGCSDCRYSSPRRYCRKIRQTSDQADHPSELAGSFCCQ